MKKIFRLNLVLLLHIYKIKKILKWNLGVKELELKMILVLIIMFLTLRKIPKNLKKKIALTSPDAIFWKETINDEIKSLISNRTWKLVDLPLGYKTIGCK